MPVWSHVLFTHSFIRHRPTDFFSSLGLFAQNLFSGFKRYKMVDAVDWNDSFVRFGPHYAAFQVILVNLELGMGPGKVAAQCCHGARSVYHLCFVTMQSMVSVPCFEATSSRFGSPSLHGGVKPCASNCVG
jgi:Peptidyl-tRNA hydrolase PTH2